MQLSQDSEISFIKQKQHKNTLKYSDKQKNKQNRKSIQNGEETKFRFQKVLQMDYCLLVFSFLNIGLSLVYYQSDYTNKINISKYCLYFINIFSIIQIFITILRYKCQIQLQKCQNKLHFQQNMYTSGKLYQVIGEIFIFSLQPYSFFNQLTIETYNVYDRFSFNFKINYILVILGFLKIFILIRVVLLNQPYMSPRSNRLCRMYGSQNSYLYGIKCIFRDQPIKLIGISFCISVIIYSICLRIAQRNLVKQYPKYFNSKEYPDNIQKFQNAIWMTIVTMTTVGFGDFSPRTIFGRVIDVTLIIWGTFIVSLMVVVITNTLNMDQNQKRALLILTRLETKKQMKQSAAFLITLACKKYLFNKKIKQGTININNVNQKQRTQLQNKFYKSASEFQQKNSQIRKMYEIDNIYQEMTRQFQVLDDQLNIITTDQIQILRNLNIKYKSIYQKRQQQNLNRLNTGLSAQNCRVSNV